MNAPELGPDEDGNEGGGGHNHWMMLACCVPMIAVAIGLVVAGVVSAGFLIVAIGCLAMMAMMMLMMKGGE